MYRFYSKPNATKVRVVVVGEYDQENRILNLAVARCSKRDSFVRKKGRGIAEGRLSKGKYFDQISMEEMPSFPMFMRIAKDIAEFVIDAPQEVVDEKFRSLKNL